PNKFSDLRGEIWTAFTKEQLGHLCPLDFVLDKFTFSHFNVLRGIHGDHKSWKLVTCVYGEIQQVVVDCRKNSPTYLRWESWNISPHNPMLILMPPNMGNAQYVKSQGGALYFYKWAYEGEYVDANDQFTYAWNDERVGIDWGMITPILSERDMLHREVKL
ncbi:dTDP-4-dehydrorhamnose 3,5-epimerase family protein, partial [Helicobacter rodentium]